MHSSDSRFPHSKHEELFTSIKGKQMEDDEGQTATSSKAFTGSSVTSVPPTVSSPSSASGRAKMSVCGPGSKMASSASLSSSSTANTPPKVHRARKTMNRPPFPQIKSIECKTVPATPEKLMSSHTTDSHSVVKKHKVVLDSDATAPPSGTPEKVARPQSEPPLTASPAMEKGNRFAMATKERDGVWLEDLDDEADEEDFHLLYNTYSGDDLIYSDSKSDDGMVEESQETGRLSEHSSGSDRPSLLLRKQVEKEMSHHGNDKERVKEETDSCWRERGK